MAKPIPDGFTAVTPYLIISDVATELEFCQKAFGAEVKFKMELPGVGIGHAEIAINGARVMMGRADINRGYPPASSMIYLYVNDCDAVLHSAVAAGATVTMPMTDMFYGDRNGSVKDANGITWSISTHIEDLTPEQIGERMQSMNHGERPEDEKKLK